MREGERVFARRVSFVAVTLAVLLVAAPTAIMLGTTHVDLQVTLRVIGARLLPFWLTMGEVSRADQIIVWLIRVPRVLLAAFVGAGLVFAGITDWCGMGLLLARAPWNQRVAS